MLIQMLVMYFSIVLYFLLTSTCDQVRVSGDGQTLDVYNKNNHWLDDNDTHRCDVTGSNICRLLKSAGESISLIAFLKVHPSLKALLQITLCFLKQSTKSLNYSKLVRASYQ